MIRVPLRDGRTLHHDIKGYYGAGKVLLRAAQAGTGIIAGGPMRAVFEVLGIQDIVAKSIGSSNPHNMIKATFSALGHIQAPRAVAQSAASKADGWANAKTINWRRSPRRELGEFNGCQTNCKSNADQKRDWPQKRPAAL